MADALLRCVASVLITGALWIGRLLYRMKVCGATKIPRSGACIFVANHDSLLDFLAVAIVLRARPDTILYGPRLNQGQVLKVWKLLRRAGIHRTPSDRESGGPALTLWWAVKMLDKGHPVIIYPEGGIRLDGRMRPLQPGAAWLALRSRVPVVVCVLRGGYAIWPRWAKLPRLTGRLELRIGEPLRIPEAACGKVTGEMIETVTRRIADEMARLENQGASEPGA